MSRVVECIKLGRPAEGLDRPPFKGELGQKLYERVSKEAWRTWLEYSKVLVNELRLDLTSERGQKIWMSECERFFFGEDTPR
jgi:Fe-S cluster biosynthesis and repair protein YggX